MGDGAKGLAGKVGAWFGRWLVPILAVLLIALGGAFLFVMLSGECPKYWSADCPEWWLKAFGVKEKSRVLEYLGIAMAGVLAAIGLVFAHRRAEAMTCAANAQAEAATQQAKANKNQAKAVKQQARANENTEKGQRQERLRDAIGHLGHDRESVRLGGAYELFHLAQDNEELRQTALDILCAHIRQTTGTEAYRETHWGKPSEEIQSLSTLLFVDKHNVFDDLRIDLQGSWLNGVELPGARLSSANLRGAYLRGADLGKAQLQKADLRDARLQGAILIGAYLKRADLSVADLWGANLMDAWAQGADLREADFTGAYLNGARLHGVRLVHAYMPGADLNAAHLEAANLYFANLRGANLRNALLQGADLVNADLRGANLGNARLQGADLVNADLRGASSGSATTGGSFAERIRNAADRDTDLSETVFAGGLTREEVLAMATEVPGSSETIRLEDALIPNHIDRPESRGLPEDSGAITGRYAAEEAEAWIAEYVDEIKGVRELWA